MDMMWTLKGKSGLLNTDKSYTGFILWLKQFEYQLILN